MQMEVKDSPKHGFWVQKSLKGTGREATIIGYQLHRALYSIMPQIISTDLLFTDYLNITIHSRE